MAPIAMRSRMARSMSFPAFRSRTVVTPVSSVLRAFSCDEVDRDCGKATLSSRPRAGLLVPVIGDVSVKIDQARQCQSICADR